jgi:streptomycin 6-kinase
MAEWQLQPDGVVCTGQNAMVVPVRTAAEQAAAVKFGRPRPRSEHEHLALRTWGGDAAVQLLRADPRRSVLLLERGKPARDLTSVPVLEACAIIAGLYARLHRPAIPQLDRLSKQSARWSADLIQVRTENLLPRRFVDQAAALARDFAADPATDGTLLHGDLHYAHVVAADREPWLAISPKPLSGDPAYEVAPLLWNRWEDATATSDVRTAVLDRLYTVVDTAELDEDRVRAWVVVRVLAEVLGALKAQRPDVGDGRRQLPRVDSGWLTLATTIVKAVQR